MEDGTFQLVFPSGQSFQPPVISLDPSSEQEEGAECLLGPGQSVSLTVLCRPGACCIAVYTFVHDTILIHVHELFKCVIFYSTPWQVFGHPPPHRQWQHVPAIPYPRVDCPLAYQLYLSDPLLYRHPPSASGHLIGRSVYSVRTRIHSVSHSVHTGCSSITLDTLMYTVVSLF